MKSKSINKSILLAYINDELSEKELIVEIEEWINRNDRNKEYFKSLKALNLASKLYDEEFAVLKKNVWERVERNTQETNIQSKPEQVSQSINWFKYISVAASVLFVVALGTIFFLLKNNNSSDSYYSFRAEAGSKSEVTLPDGTLVYLNSETELRLPQNFNNGNRHVTLFGEAYFKVQKTENKSLFVVNTGDIAIKVLGTEFNVKSYPNEGTIETTLEKGKIKLEKKFDNGNGNKELLTLKPNQRAVFVKKEGDIQLSEIAGEYPENTTSEKGEKVEIGVREEKLLLTEQIETGIYTSWKEGKLVFKSERFDNLLVRMERWYGIEIRLDNDSLKAVQFTGTLKNETIEQALDALKISQPFNYKMDIKNNIVFIN